MLTSEGLNIFSDEQVIDIIRCSPGRFVFYLGAGASVEAGVPTAEGICDELAQELVEAEEKRRRFEGYVDWRLTAEERERLWDEKTVSPAPGWRTAMLRMNDSSKTHGLLDVSRPWSAVEVLKQEQLGYRGLRPLMQTDRTRGYLSARERVREEYL